MPIVTKIIIKDIWVLIKLLKKIQVLKKALEDYKRIKQGDYAVMRARNAHYYIGKVKKRRNIYIKMMKASTNICHGVVMLKSG